MDEQSKPPVNVVSMQDFKKRKEEEEDDDAVLLVEFDGDDFDVGEIVYLTAEQDVALLSHPHEKRGISLTPGQAEVLGTALIRYGALAPYVPYIAKVVDEEGVLIRDDDKDDDAS